MLNMFTLYSSPIACLGTHYSCLFIMQVLMIRGAVRCVLKDIFIFDKLWIAKFAGWILDKYIIVDIKSWLQHEIKLLVTWCWNWKYYCRFHLTSQPNGSAIRLVHLKHFLKYFVHILYVCWKGMGIKVAAANGLNEHNSVIKLRIHVLIL